MGSLEDRIIRLEQDRNELLRRLAKVEAEGGRDASRFAGLRTGGFGASLLLIGGWLAWLMG